MQIYYQLNWILNKYKENTFFYFLLIDIVNSILIFIGTVPHTMYR
jgi:hypothetical protein